MKAFDNSQLEKYEAETKEKWGNTQSYQQYQEKQKTIPRRNGISLRRR